MTWPYNLGSSLPCLVLSIGFSDFFPRVSAVEKIPQPFRRLVFRLPTGAGVAGYQAPAYRIGALAGVAGRRELALSGVAGEGAAFGFQRGLAWKWRLSTGFVRPHSRIEG